MQKIPLVDLQAQYSRIRPEIDHALAEVLASAAFIMGPQVAAFEDAFAAFCGAGHCVGVGSGTAALELSLHALGIGRGDEVITVAHTFIATAEAISAVGAKPIFVDVDPHTYTLDPGALAAAVTSQSRAVIPVHLYGQPADMTAINALAAQHGLWVIEDAAQAHGASWAGRPVGTLGHVGCFSFYPGKNLGAYGDAGAVVTADAQIAETVRLLRNHGRRAKYEHEIKGYGERLDTLQAAVLSVKLGHLRAWTAARRALAATYTNSFVDLDLTLPGVAPDAAPVWHLYVICTPQRDALARHLASQGIATGVHYPIPLHLQPAYADMGLRAGALPVTERVAAQCLSLPMYPELSQTQQARVINAVREFFGAPHLDCAAHVMATAGKPGD